MLRSLTRQTIRKTPPLVACIVSRDGIASRFRCQGARFRSAIGVGREAQPAEGKPLRVLGAPSAVGAAEVR